MVREGVLQTPTQVEFNGWLLEQISGGGSTFDKVLSIFQKVVSIIGIVKKIASLVFVVPLGRRREDESEEPSEENEEPTDDEFLIGLNEAISSGTIFDNVYTKSQVDALLNQYNGALSGFVSSSGGTYGAPFVFSSLQNQFTGSITTDSLTMDGNNVTAIKRSSHNNVSNNNKLTTQAYVDEQLANYLSLYEAEQTYQTQADMVNYLTTSDASNTYQPKSAMTVYLTSANASSTYLTKTDAASTYEKKTDLASSVTTNSLTLNNKTVTDITTGGSSNNNKLTTQGYVDGVLGSYLPSSNASSTYLTKTDAASTYEKKTDLASSVTTASLTLNNKTVTDVSTGGSSNNNKLATQGYVDYTIAGDVSMALSSYLPSSTAASTYQPISGMSNYLTTSDAASTYQTQSGMSNYLTSSNASSIYLAKNSLPYYFDATYEIVPNYKIFIGNIEITWYYYASDNTYVSTSYTHEGAFCILKGDRAIVNCVVYIPKFTNQNNSQFVFIKQIKIGGEKYGGMYYAGQFNNNGTMNWRYAGSIMGTAHNTPVTVILEEKTSGDMAGYLQICYYYTSTRYDGINTSQGWQLQFSNVSFYKIPS